jgi:hypothetical protein
MRYRLMASYLGASYQAAVGPSDHDVTLFAAPPPPEEHGFSPAPGGIWRKQVRLNDLSALWESRPIGSYHGEPCLVLDDLGDRLHIVYLGMDEQRAAQLGYWEVDRGVFEVVVPRHDITDLAEERHEFPIALLLSALPRALGAGGGFDQHVTGSASGGSGPGGMTGWNGPSAAPQPARGQLPAGSQAQLPQAPLPQAPLPQAQSQQAQSQQAQLQQAQSQQAQSQQAQLQQAQSQQAQSQQAQRQQAQLQQAQLPPGQLPARQQQPAAAGPQFPPAGPYQLPAGPERGAGLPGAPGPATAGGALSGQPGVQGARPAAMNLAQPPVGPTLPSRPQLPMAQQAPGAQPPLGAQPSPGPQQPFALQFPQSSPQAPVTGQGTGPQQASPAPPALAQPAQLQAPLAPPSQPSFSQASFSQASLAQPSQLQTPQAPPAQPAPAPAPAAVAAWHGSPAPDGSGTWYFQPGPDHTGAAASGYLVSGMPQNGYAQPDQGAVQAAPPGRRDGTQQYAQPAPQPPGPAYQQAPTDAGQPQAGQPTQLAPLPPAAQQAPAAPAPQFLQQPPPSPQQAPLPVTQPAGTASRAEPAAPAMTSPLTAQEPSAAPVAAAPAAEVSRTGPLAPSPPAGPEPQSSGGLAAGALGKLTGAVRGRRAARKPRLAMSAIFADLVDMADIPRSAYAVDEEVTGAMCLFKTDGGYEVFSCAEDARHEVRFFEEEESAYFYLFGVLAAEALRNGRLSSRRG